MSIVRKLRRSYEKNAEEIRALATGRMPRFVLGSSGLGGVPVFVLHDVRPEPFERDVNFLLENGYTAVTAGEAVAREGAREAGRAVALTFDDATWTFWAYAYPLLAAHGMRATLFAIPGLVRDTDETRPNLNDLWAGRASAEEIAAAGKREPVCTRGELQAMHASGLVDVQSHTMTHQRVPVAPVVEDFLNPRFDADTYGNVRVPLSVFDDPRAPARELRLGAPVFRSASRMSGRRRFVESRALVESLLDHVAASGGERFFERRGWRSELGQIVARAPERGVFESPEETESAVRDELVRSRRAIESMLPGHRVRHLAYPWFVGSPLADRAAAEAGYEAAFYGLLPPRGTGPIPRASRLSDQYLLRLPGRGRASLVSVWGSRARRFGAPSAR